MSWNCFGRLLRFTSWGESHGPAIGVVVDGCPPGLLLDEAHVQRFLDARRPGTGRNVSPRQEPDRARILSGIYLGRTTGTPIACVIENVDARSKDYAGLPPRPGHADAAYDAKYGFRDPRGGGRASARETAMRVAAGAIARLVIPEVTVTARVAEIGGEADPARWDRLLDEARANQDSLGAIIECSADGVPAGWGAPVYAKLDADLAAAVMGINAVKGVEIGEGFAAGRAHGQGSSEAMASSGIDGGISTGKPIRLRAAFKPTSSIGIGGRHDPCVGIRGAPVVEAMVAFVLADHKLLHRGQCG
jgi:chorismate synthase